MFAPCCLRQLAIQRSLQTHLLPRCVQRTFSSSSTRFLRRHHDNSRFADQQKDGSPDGQLSPEFLELLDKKEDDPFQSAFEEEDEAAEEKEDFGPMPTTFWNWLDEVAPEFRDPKPRNWLGGNVPFPLNPSFKPPTPLSDALRSQLYQSYMTDPETNSVRALSSKHNISLKRVDAILRLKGLEEAWKKGKPLQTGFTQGMEWLLAAPEPQVAKERASDEPIQYYHTGQKEVTNEDPSRTNPRYHVEEADRQGEVEGTNDMARFRYQRMFWENVAEGEEPVMPAILEAARSSSRPIKQKPKVMLVEPRPGRPAIKFVDIGNAFFDEQEQERRDKEGARRAQLRARKRGPERAQRNVA